MGVDAAVPLPKSLKEFGDEKYWDDFFRASKGQAFEWYGSWADLPQLLQLHCGLRPDQQPSLQILVVGCGNSALSAHMYDAGFTSIVNVDFNRRVITEMLRLHVRARPLMRWLVMDITALQVFSFVLSLSLSSNP
jgi:2-polyprenyl-3-methyl-5-hydroxy-6-metoxy-1,4-benzoquinol methylase